MTVDRRLVLLVILVNLLLTIVREVFEFLGYLWCSIAVTFLHILAAVIAVFGIAQDRRRLLLVVICWIPFWILWNVFLICLFLSVGGLDRADHPQWLSWGSTGRSWWYANAPSCRVHYSQSLSDPVVTDCVVPYYTIEVTIAVVHSIYAVLILGFLVHLLRRHSSHKQQHSPVTVPASCASKDRQSKSLHSVHRLPVSERHVVPSGMIQGITNKSFELDDQPEPERRNGNCLVPNYRRGGEGSRLLKKRYPRFVDQLRQDGAGDSFTIGDQLSSPSHEMAHRSQVDVYPMQVFKGSSSSRPGAPREHMVHASHSSAVPEEDSLHASVQYSEALYRRRTDSLMLRTAPMPRVDKEGIIV